MKKPFIFLVLLCSSLLSFSQEKIANETHPFQVLFVDSAEVIGENRQLRQFDYSRKEDSLQIIGEIVLVHFTGKISVLKDVTFLVDDLAKIRFKEGLFNRPIISNLSINLNKETEHREKLNPTMGIKICGTQEIRIVFPKFNGEENISDKSKEEVHLLWEPDENYESYIVRFVNIFDDELFKAKTELTHIEIPRSFFSTYDLIIGEIMVKDKETTSGTFAIRFQETPKIEKYQQIITALEEQWIGNKQVAQILFLEAIEASNQDPRFIQLYEDFQERNSPFKAKTE